jgi:hypothetical protein
MGIAARVLLAAAFVFPAAAQQSIQILSDDSSVLVGRTLKFSAIVRDAQGNPVQGGAVTWAVNNATIGTIAQDGTFTARLLGTVRVQARSGSLFAETAIQTLPSRVAIFPESARIDVDQRESFSAKAYDADGREIAGFAWSWSVTNHRLGTSQVGRIDALGNFTGVTEGGAVVQAVYTYGDLQPGLQRQLILRAPVEVSVPRAYELQRLWHRGRTRKSGFELRAKPTMLWSSDDGYLFFNASLGGLANGLASLETATGSIRLVSTGGEPRVAQGSFATEFRTHSVTRQGAILTWEDTNINGAQINIGHRGEILPHISNNTPLAGNEATSALVLNRCSLNDKGWSIVRANFRFENNPITYNGLFLGANGRYNDLLISTQETLPGITGAFTIDGDFGVDGSGAAVYSVTAGANRVVFRHNAEGRKRLLGVGDELLGSTVRSFAGGRGNHPTFWVDEDSTVVLAVVLNNNTTHYLRILPDGKLESLQMSGQSGILWHHPAAGTLFHGNPFNNKGNGAWLWPKSGDPVPVLLYSSHRVNGEVVQDIESGAINGKSEIFLYVRGATTNMMIAQFGGNEPRVLAKSGDRVDVEAPLNVISFIGGARAGNPHVYAGGSSGSIVEWTADGPQTMLAYGERLFGNNTMWFGGFTGNTWNLRKSPHGEVYFSTGSGIGRMTGDWQPELFVRFPLRVGTLTINAPTNFDVNSRGEILFVTSTSAGDSRFFVLPPGGEGEPKEILTYSATAATATTINGRIASGFDSFAFDDLGRVLVSLRFRNLGVPVLYLYDNGSWRELALPNTTRVETHTITGIANLHRAGGGRLYAGLSIQGGNILCEWINNRWEIIVNNTSRMPSGQVATTVVNQEANRNGDLLFQHSNGGNNFLVVRRGERLHQVLNLFRPTADGDYLIRINAVDFRDDGTVFLLAMNAEDELVLYKATPLF